PHLGRAKRLRRKRADLPGLVAATTCRCGDTAKGGAGPPPAPVEPRKPGVPTEAAEDWNAWTAVAGPECRPVSSSRSRPEEMKQSEASTAFRTKPEDHHALNPAPPLTT